MSLHPIAEASHRLCAALHMENIDPAQMEISMPRLEWWKFYTRLEQLNRGFMVFDGRDRIPDQFKYMGITYKAK